MCKVLSRSRPWRGQERSRRHGPVCADARDLPGDPRDQPGALGEIQLTDAISKLLGSGEVWGLEFEGELLDVGTPAGWLATNLRLAQQYPEFSGVVASMQGMVGA